MSRRRNFATNHSGAHYLRSARIARQLVRSAAPAPGQLVLDLGAGAGAVTEPLAASGARVIAVEREPARIATLRARFADRSQVRVVQDDIRTVPLPSRPYLVVASLPFAITTVLLRRLLDDSARLAGADLIVEWGLAKRLTTARPRDLATAWWAVRYELRLDRRVPAACFAPPPAVDAAHLRIRPRAGLGRGARSRLWTVLRAAYGSPGTPVGKLLRGVTSASAAGNALAEADIPARTPAGELTAEQWFSLGSRIG